jgi:hypothetical protein
MSGIIFVFTIFGLGFVVISCVKKKKVELEKEKVELEKEKVELNMWIGEKQVEMKIPIGKFSGTNFDKILELYAYSLRLNPHLPAI